MATSQGTMLIEEWKPLVGYDGLYEISNEGRIRSVRKKTSSRPGKILRGWKHGLGYRCIRLSRDGVIITHYVHRLVLMTFVGLPNAGHECNHKDGDKANNVTGNLEWVSKSANRKHAVDILLKCVGESHGNAKLTESAVRNIRTRLRRSHAQARIAAWFGVSQRTVWNIKHRRAWAHVK